MRFDEPNPKSVESIRAKRYIFAFDIPAFLRIAKQENSTFLSATVQSEFLVGTKVNKNSVIKGQAPKLVDLTRKQASTRPVTFPVSAAMKSIPGESVRIGKEAPFLFDGYIVDNQWAIHYQRQAMKRVVHQAVKPPGNPVMAGDQASYLTAARGARSNLFRM